MITFPSFAIAEQFVIFVGTCGAKDSNHPSRFLKKEKEFSRVEFNDSSMPQSIELRGGSTSVLSDGIMTVINDIAKDNPAPRPVIHYKSVPDEFICHMRIKLDGKDYKPKNPWLDIGGHHRNHFRFDGEQVLFSSEDKELSKRNIDNGRPGNMLPLNKWLHITVEMEKGRIGLSINGKSQIYEDPKIEIGNSRKIGLKAIPGGALHVDYIRVWNVSR
ncbi:MAG: hypothetical protein AAGI63_03275 [Planctomycetota bacterium]